LEGEDNRRGRRIGWGVKIPLTNKVKISFGEEG